MSGNPTLSRAAPRKLALSFGRLGRAIWRRLALVGTLALVAAIVLLAVLAPWISPTDPYDLATVSIMDARLPPGSVSAFGDVTYWLGTDGSGRDVLSAVLYGLRTSLWVAISSTAISLVLGMSVGVTAAYLGGRFDVYAMRIVDLQLSFPTMLVAMVVLAILGQGVNNIIMSIVIVQWAYFARSARASALVESSKEYVEAARCLRLSHLRIIFRHILPNSLPPLIVIATIEAAKAVSLEATLSFLGLGLPPTEPSLGLLISNGFRYIHSFAWWITLFPGIALFVVVVSINLAGDQIRVYFNPRNR